LPSNIRLEWEGLTLENTTAYSGTAKMTAVKRFIVQAPGPSVLYHKNITILNDTSRVVRMMIVGDAPSCGIT
jgi:hypothetical protein